MYMLHLTPYVLQNMQILDVTTIDNRYNNHPSLECIYVYGILYTDLSDQFPFLL